LDRRLYTTGFPETEKSVNTTIPPNFLPGDAFPDHIAQGQSQGEQVETAEQSWRKETATQKMMVPLGPCCIGPPVHRVKFTSWGCGGMIRDLQPEHSYCSCRMSSDRPEWQVLGSHPGHLVENPEEVSRL